MTDYRVPELEPARFPLTGTRLIEASAGTGKTFTLAALYVRLVLGHGGTEFGPPDGQPLLPTQLLVVTFTNAATAELRDRIRRRLVEVAQVFRGDMPEPDPISRDIVADYPQDEHAACAARLELAAEWMDEAAVFTIHGWCQRMLTEHAFDAGTQFTPELIRDEQELALAAAQDYWRQFLYPASDNRLLQYLGQVARSPEELLRLVRPWLQPGAAQYSIQVGGEEVPEPLEPQAAVQQLAPWFRQVEQKLEDLHRVDWQSAYEMLCESMAQGSFKANVYQPKTWANTDQPRWEALVASPGSLDIQVADHRKWVQKFTQAKIASTLKKGQGPAPQHRLFELLEELAELLEQEPQVWPAVAHHAAHWLKNEISRRKRSQGQLTFNDLLSQLHDALTGAGGETLAARIRAQFPVAMVDEFQDTDPVQLAIFRAVYPVVDSRETALVLVGDPKQAIYSFRGADLFTYLAARRLTRGRHYNLPRNFRSATPLVEQVNALFHQAETAPGQAFDMPAETTEPLPFLPVRAVGRADQFWYQGRPRAGVHYWHQDQPTAELKSGAYEATMAQACARQIASLLRAATTGAAGFGPETVDQPLQAGDIAVLVRKGKQADLVRQELQRLAIRSVYLSERDSVFDSAEAAAVLAWLQAVQSPEDENLVRGALLLPVCAISDAEFARWHNDEQRWEDILERLRELRQQWRWQGVLPMLRAWLHYFELPERWLAHPTQGERTLTNVLHLAELLQQESQFREGTTGLVRWFSQQLTQPEHHDEQIMRLESDANLIKVVTIHKSKGLQYPLVFVPFATSFRALRSNDQVSYHQGEQAVTDLEITGAAKELADRERRQEDIRLMYVALTRAVYQVWLGVSAYSVGRSNTSMIANSGLGYVLKLPNRCDQNDLAGALAALPWQSEPLPEQVEPVPAAPAQHWQPAARPAGQVARERWWIASYSALQAGSSTGTASPDTAREAQSQDDDDSVPQRLPQAGSIHTLPRGAAVGTFLHGLLEWCCEQGFSQLQREPARLTQLLAQRLPLRGWQEHESMLTAWLQEMLQVPVAGCQVNLAELPRAVSEMEFWLGSRQVSVARLDAIIQRYIWPGMARPPLVDEQVNGMVKGFVDLTYQAPDGRYWVLDFKSNWLGPDDQSYSQKNMQQAILQKRYDVQASLYLFALHRLLLARQPGYRDHPEDYLGGAHYWFVRAPGQGQCVLRPPIGLLTELDTLFRGRTPVAHEEVRDD